MTLARAVPVMVSFTAVDMSGRNLSGQTVEAFYASVSHIPLLSVELTARWAVNRFDHSLRNLLMCHLTLFRATRTQDFQTSLANMMNHLPTWPLICLSSLKADSQHRGKLLRLNPRTHSSYCGGRRRYHASQPALSNSKHQS